MPDSSLMLELCEILKINVNELLSGERLDMEDYNLSPWHKNCFARFMSCYLSGYFANIISKGVRKPWISKKLEAY